jgi:nucleoside-diphosphate-sugar epimerase
MNKKILVIGSQGYLGSLLTQYLEDRNYDCEGIDTGFFLEGTISAPHKVPTVSKDVRSIKKEDIAKYSSVILLAGISNDPFGNLTSEKIYDPTRDYAIKIATFCKELEIKFIYPSSCSVYGASGTEDSLEETDKTNPQTPYSLNKIQVEDGLKRISDSNFSPIALRFGTVYGFSPRIRFDVVINMLCGLALTTNKITLNSDGQAWRPHLHIEDACESIRCSIDWEYDKGKLMVLNVGNDEDNLKIIDIAKIINSNVPGSELNYLDLSSNEEINELVKDRKIQDGVDTRTYKVSFNKIHSLMPGFKSNWTVQTGVEDLISKLLELKIENSTFNKREFYRLQQIEHLYNSKRIDDNLYWVK